MDTSTHRKILAEMYGCGENQLLAQFERMMPQIRNEAIMTLSVPRSTTATERKTVDAPPVYA